MASEVYVQVNQVGPTTSEGVIRGHTVLIDRPEAKGGDDLGPMGGELLLSSLGGCFMSNLLAAIRARDADITGVEIGISGTLDGKPTRFTSVRMDVKANGRDIDLLEKLVTISERSCIVANTLRDAVELTVTVA